ncbi:hypothetical protein ACVNP1_03840 [Staphylococcus aureus]
MPQIVVGLPRCFGHSFTEPATRIVSDSINKRRRPTGTLSQRGR